MHGYTTSSEFPPTTYLKYCTQVADFQPCYSEAHQGALREVLERSPVVMQDLELDQLYVIYPGTRRSKLDEGVEVVPLEMLSHLN